MPTVQPKTANRPAVTSALLEEYCKKFRNWGRWGPEDEIGTLNFGRCSAPGACRCKVRF